MKLIEKSSSHKQLSQKITGQNGQLLENKMGIGEPSAENCREASESHEWTEDATERVTVPSFIREQWVSRHRPPSFQQQPPCTYGQENRNNSSRDSLSHVRSKGRPLREGKENIGGKNQRALCFNTKKPQQYWFDKFKSFNINGLESH